MKQLILIVIIILVIRFIVKKRKANSDSEDSAFTPPAPGSRAEKKAIEDFNRSLTCATSSTGELAIYNMDRLAEAYEKGNGVEKNIEKAKEWAERSFRERLRTRGYINEASGFEGYGCHLDSFYCGETADYDKAEELALLAALNGTQSAKEELTAIYKVKYPDHPDRVDVDRMISDYPVMCLGNLARSKKQYAECCEAMKAAGVSGQAAMMEWLLNKAGMNVSVKPVTFPGATAETEEQFKAARALEAKGQDYKATAAAYEAPAAAGHSEAMRRLGRIKRDILSEYDLSDTYKSGVEWLTKAAEAGNALAAFDLGDKNPDVSFLAGLAGMGNLDAVYALGCLVQGTAHVDPEQAIMKHNIVFRGEGNYDMGQAIFRHMEAMIGDAIANKDGEGMEWLLKLGEKLGEINDEYFVRLADAGNEIGYAPCQNALIRMTDVMMCRAYAKNGNQLGDHGDFGFSSYVIELAKAPCKAGIEQAKALSKALREEGYAFDKWSKQQLTDAEKGTGITWQGSFGSKFTPKERVARETATIILGGRILCATRRQKGMNFHEIHSQVYDSDEYDEVLNELLRRM